ncbi:hypothetical protein PHLCEN_2v2110 [Hermanssonia centrifuga]|uniref:Uncharacterized protein n=1 Tax=Hermanssonia centrifuga TaxID=98765 RepID=A0A2R6RQ09_9APHY|nr:hypothetical protein PHLCEN_2v2110 [Hermanssonia centrifuga]
MAATSWKSLFVAQTAYKVHRPVRFTERGPSGMLLISALYQKFKGLQDSTRRSDGQLPKDQVQPSRPSESARAPVS